MINNRLQSYDESKMELEVQNVAREEACHLSPVIRGGD
jgi:hypothetical protein